ncbi:hypothetical protein Afil01_59830 [Actinorhabdospora filicis]|uniref:SecDF P1 head subdomain domain-containing protein n=1 Tax=Actinorhabdospora filicis TaxID=1785913 RepID=A0A9W6SUV7_9ACTN|nr:hypothetical protein [Actinorhabdospora filicis]GLZ81176.1 hypothetical protein Afil01_59830 [Actinorhabdospora filicis]
MKYRVTPLLAGLALVLTACGAPPEARFQWPEAVRDPGALQFRVVEQTVEDVPGETLKGTATTLDAVWAKVGPDAAALAQSLTYPAVDPQSMGVLAPFAQLSPAEIALLPAAVQFNVPYVSCAQLDHRDAQLPEQAAVACDQKQKYLLGPVAMNGGDLADVAASFATNGNGWIVTLTFNTAGTQRWADLTSRAVQKQVAIILGDQILTAPVILEAMTGGNAEISANFSQDLAVGLADRLRDAVWN